MKKLDKLFQDTEKKKNEKYENQEIILTNNAINPFQNWSDWYGENGEVVVTFITMKQHLYANWSRQAINTNAIDTALKNGEPVSQNDYIQLIQHQNFENNFQGPGTYLDSTHYLDDNKVDESYTIILPEEFMTEKTCRNWIKKLNEKHDRNFKLKNEDYQKQKIMHNAKHTQKQIKNEENKEIDLKTIKTVLKHRIL